MTETIEEYKKPLTDPAIQRLNHLYSIAHERDQARYVLALLTIIRLSDGSQRVKKELTAPYTKGSKEGKAVQKEGMAKEWHRQFMDQLINHGFVIQVNISRQLTYQAADAKAEKALAMIVEDALFEDGQQLKQLLWPSDNLNLTEVLQDEHDAEHGIVAVAEKSDEGLDAVKEVAAQLKLVAEHLGRMYEGLNTLDQRLDQKMTLLDQTLNRLDEKLVLFASLEQKVDNAFDRLIKGIEKDERVQLTVLADKMVEIGSRRTSLANQWESEGRRLDKALEELKQLGVVPKGK